jgi:hypothetical protein
MTILETTRQIIQKHKLEEKLSFNPFKERRKSKSGGCGWEGGAVIGFNSFPEFQGSYEKETTLQIRYFNRVPDGYYGFDCSCWPINWLNALEEFLAELEKDSPDFEIFQVKLKLGGSRIYLGNLSEDARKAVYLLENAMSDDNLIY